MWRKPRGTRSFRLVEIEFVHPLIVEPQHALRAMHFDFEPVLPAMRNAARTSARRVHRCESDNRMGDVVIFDVANFPASPLSGPMP